MLFFPLLLEFGFEQTTLTGEERSESYSVNVGFLSGTHSGPVVLRFDFDFNGTAGQPVHTINTLVLEKCLSIEMAERA